MEYPFPHPTLIWSKWSWPVKTIEELETVVVATILHPRMGWIQIANDKAMAAHRVVNASREVILTIPKGRA